MKTKSAETVSITDLVKIIIVLSGSVLVIVASWCFMETGDPVALITMAIICMGMYLKT